MGVLNTIWTNLTGGNRTLNNATNKQMSHPHYDDFTEKITVNKEVTYGLYYNQLTGYKLAGGLTKKPIDLPVAFMGIPAVDCEDETKKEDLIQILKDRTQHLSAIFKESHRDGTIWVYPRVNKKGFIVWEVIDDEAITDVVRDLDTREIIAVYSSEQIRVTTGFGKYETVDRMREWTRKYVKETYSKEIAGLTNKEGINAAGIMPVPFANNKDINEIRGHSDYTNIVTDLKVYHDTKLEMHRILTKFKPKLVQSGKDYNSWVKNNLNGSIANLNLETVEFIFNTIHDDGNSDNSNFIFMKDQVAGHLDALKNCFKCLVDGSNVPELFWGTTAKGNHATSEEQMQSFVKYVFDKRGQHDKALNLLLEYTYKLQKMTEIGNGKYSDEPINIKWGMLSALSEKNQAEVFKMFAESANSLITSAGMTKSQLFTIWKNVNPGATDMTLEEFKSGLSDMAMHKVFSNASYPEALEMGAENED